MSQPTQTAVVVPVSPAEDLVAEYRSAVDGAAPAPGSAYVTVAHPFVPPEQLSVDVLQRLSAAVRSEPAFTCTFSRFGWAGDTLTLLPDDDLPFRDLVAAVSRELPEHQPYGRPAVDVVPHLVVGSRLGADPDALRAAEVGVSRRLPLTVDVDHAVLVARSGGGGPWHTLVRLPLGARGSLTGSGWGPLTSHRG